MKKFKGFTLIELIVVIAIIGVLAAILVPSVMGWVTKSRIATYNNNATEVFNHVQILLTDCDAVGVRMPDCTIYCDRGVVTADGVDAETVSEMEQINKYLTDSSESVWAVVINNGMVNASVFTANDFQNIGGYPCPCPRDISFMGVSKKASESEISDYLAYASGENKWSSTF